MTQKKNIIVVDLDGTLIPFDSFRMLVLKNIFDFRIISLIFIRILRFISNANFKYQFIKILEKKDWGYKKSEIFVDKIIMQIDSAVMQKIKSNSVSDDYIILCSASPNIYVSKIASRLGWKGYGSFDKEKKTKHLYGRNKKDFIIQNFPPEQYNYKYSISDSKSDMDLLNMFETWELITR